MNFKEALIAHLQGQNVQCMGSGTWKPLMEKIGEGLIRYVDAPSYMSGLSFRIAPRTILVNGVEVPAPEKEAPKKGATYFIPVPHSRDKRTKLTWDDDRVDNGYLSDGLVHMHEEHAIARAKAMLITQEVL